MRFIEPYYEVVDQTGIELIERAGRCCYQSESKGEPEKFCRMLISRGHESVLEHMWLHIRGEDLSPAGTLMEEGTGGWYCNVRMLRDWVRRFHWSHRMRDELLDRWPCLFSDLTHIGTFQSSDDVSITETYQHTRTVYFEVDRGVSHELVRHRMASFSQESTRYCNYGGAGITLVHPQDLTPAQYRRREKMFQQLEELYDAEIEEGITPQLARGVLPTCLKTALYMTATWREWKHVLVLRTSQAAHPQMREVMNPLFRDLAPWLDRIGGYVSA